MSMVMRLMGIGGERKRFVTNNSSTPTTALMASPTNPPSKAISVVRRAKINNATTNMATNMSTSHSMEEHFTRTREGGTSFDGDVALAPYEEFKLGGKTYYFTPGGFLYRKDPGTGALGASSVDTSPMRSGTTGPTTGAPASTVTSRSGSSMMLILIP